MRYRQEGLGCLPPDGKQGEGEGEGEEGDMCGGEGGGDWTDKNLSHFVCNYVIII